MSGRISTTVPGILLIHDDDSTKGNLFITSSTSMEEAVVSHTKVANVEGVIALEASMGANLKGVVGGQSTINPE